MDVYAYAKTYACAEMHAGEHRLKHKLLNITSKKKIYKENKDNYERK